MLWKKWSGGAKVLSKLSVPGRLTNMDNNRAWTNCAYSMCGWRLFGHFYSNLSFPSSFSLSLGEGPIQTKTLSQRAVKPETTNQPTDALEEQNGKVTIGGRTITSLRFADEIDALAEEEQKLEALVKSLDKSSTRNKMEISVETNKLMTNRANGIQREIKVKGQKLGTGSGFKYLGAIVSDEGSNRRFSQELHE